MKKQGPNVWLVGLIMVASIYLTMLALVAVFWLPTINVATLPSFSVGLSIVLIGFAVYFAIRKKQATYLSIGLTVAGIILITLGAFLFAPYTMSQTYGTGVSYDLTHLIVTRGDSSEPFVDQNGTLIENTIPPLSSNTYHYIVEFDANFSIYQFAYSGSGDVNFEIIGRSYDGSYEIIFLNETFFGGRAGYDWDWRWWTPPREFHSLEYNFNFTNLQNQTVSFFFRMTQFYHQESIEAASKNYRSIMDPTFAYAGLSMVCVAVAISTFTNRQSKTAQAVDSPST